MDGEMIAVFVICWGLVLAFIIWRISPSHKLKRPKTNDTRGIKSQIEAQWKEAGATSHDTRDQITYLAWDNIYKNIIGKDNKSEIDDIFNDIVRPMLYDEDLKLKISKEIYEFTFHPNNILDIDRRPYRNCSFYELERVYLNNMLDPYILILLRYEIIEWNLLLARTNLLYRIDMALKEFSDNQEILYINYEHPEEFDEPEIEHLYRDIKYDIYKKWESEDAIELEEKNDLASNILLELALDCGSPAKFNALNKIMIRLVPEVIRLRTDASLFLDNFYKLSVRRNYISPEEAQQTSDLILGKYQSRPISFVEKQLFTYLNP